MKPTMVHALEGTHRAVGNKLFVASDGLLKSAEDALKAAGGMNLTLTFLSVSAHPCLLNCAPACAGIKVNCSTLMQGAKGVETLKTIFLWKKGMDMAALPPCPGAGFG